MFISITFTETSIDETNKTQQKVRGSKFMFKMSTIYANTMHSKHSRKSEAQNLCSKCPPFTRTHAFKRLRHCAIADGFGDSVQSWCYAAALLGTMG